MLSIVKAGSKVAAKAVLVYVIKKYAASVVFDLAIEWLENLARRTDTETDDTAIKAIKADKKDLIAIIKGRTKCQRKNPSHRRSPSLRSAKLPQQAEAPI